MGAQEGFGFLILIWILIGIVWLGGSFILFEVWIWPSTILRIVIVVTAAMSVIVGLGYDG